MLAIKPIAAFATSALISLTAAADGLTFKCDSSESLARLEPQLSGLMRAQGIKSSWYIVDKGARTLSLTLNVPEGQTSTVYLHKNPEYGISFEPLEIKGPKGVPLNVNTVSKKEILLALMHPGRETVFEGAACNIEALKDHVGVRQSIVAWAEQTRWGWPDGGPAFWNEKLWDKGTPKKGVPLHKAMLDIFTNQREYGVGCYTAIKFIMVQGVVDYYTRIKGDPSLAKLVEDRMWADQDPLLQVEPAAKWSYEADFDPSLKDNPGKLLKVLPEVAAGNFIPGDWAYLLNEDPVSNKKVGYEGSNAVYLGSDRFGNFYSRGKSFTFKENLEKVWQWRNGVFSLETDGHLAKPLSDEDFLTLQKTPSEGGLLLPHRAVPYLFGYEALAPVRSL